MLPNDLRVTSDSHSSVLAWNNVLHGREGGPALEVWNCLVWQECIADDGSSSCVLKALNRHPQHGDVWTWQSPSHSPLIGLRPYHSALPTLKDAYEFLYAADWDLGPEAPGRNDSIPDQILGAGLRMEEWKHRIGSLPSVPIPPEDPEAREERKSRSAFFL